MTEVFSDLSLQLDVPGGTPVALLVGLGVLAVIALGAREVLRLQSPKLRAALVGLRLLTGSLVLLFVLQPQVVQQEVQRMEGRLAVLLDTSRSMSVVQAGGTRAQAARELVDGFLQQANSLVLYGFAGDLSPLTGQDVDQGLDSYGDDTRIEGALRELSHAHREDVGAILLLSDGGELSEEWSPERLRNLGIRVHTVLIGSDQEVRDDAITEVRADPVAFLRQGAEVEVTLRMPAGELRRNVVSLRREGRLIGEAEVQLDGQGRGTAVLPFTPTQLGRGVYTVSIPVRSGDAVPENNERSFIVRVSRDRLRVLLVSGRPSWDSRFLRSFLKADPAIDLITFFILRTTSDLTMAPPEELSLIPFPTDELFREHLDSFDLVVFQDFNYGPYQMARYLPRVRDYVLKGGSFAMIGGELSFGSGDYQRTPIAEVLPVRMGATGNAVVEQAFSPSLAEGISNHPVVELLPGEADNAQLWAELSPLLGANAIAGLQGDGQALLVHPKKRGDDGQPMPVLAVGGAGEGRTMALATDTSWRWGITTAGIRGDASAYERFWDRALRWLSRDPLLDPSRIETDREQYGPGAELQAQMVLRDPRYEPLVDAPVRLVILDGNGQVKGKLATRTDAEGRVEATMDVPAEPGGYQLVVSPAQATEPLADQGFVVEAGGRELADPRPRAQVMQGVASATGGDYFPSPDRVPPLSQLDRTRSRTLGTTTHRPFSSFLFFVILVAALLAEWGVRRTLGFR